MAIPFIGRVRFFSSRKAPADIPMAPPIELIIAKERFHWFQLSLNSYLMRTNDVDRFIRELNESIKYTAVNTRRLNNVQR
jgi:hypothetical protein